VYNINGALNIAKKIVSTLSGAYYYVFGMVFIPFGNVKNNSFHNFTGFNVAIILFEHQTNDGKFVFC